MEYIKRRRKDNIKMDNNSGGSYGILYRVPLRAHVYNAINHRSL